MCEQPLSDAAILSPFILTCDECDEEVTMFTLDTHLKLFNWPCGHFAAVTLSPSPSVHEDESA